MQKAPINSEQWLADAWMSLGIEWLSLNMKTLLEFRWSAEVLLPECRGRSDAEEDSPRMQMDLGNEMKPWNGMKMDSGMGSFYRGMMVFLLRFGWKSGQEMEMAMDWMVETLQRVRNEATVVQRMGLQRNCGRKNG